MPVSGATSTPSSTPPTPPPSGTSTDTSPSGSSGTSPDGSTPASDPAAAFESGLSQKKRRAAERALGRAGLFGGNVDGKLTKNTRKAVRSFQLAHGLERNGRLDQPTFRRLMKLSRAIQKQGKATGRVGMKSGRIRNIEKRLRKLGYDPGKVDGLFTKKTADAVTHFKKDQGMDNTAGSIAKRAQKALRQEDVAVSHAPHRVRVQDTKARKRADAHVTQLAQRVHGDGTRGLGRGAKAKGAVKTVQRHLRAAGYDPKHTSGNFDDRTEGMVKQFQKKSGLPATGRVNAATWKKLRRATLEATGPASPQQRKGERSAAVKKTERLLKKLGFHPGKVDGFYDAKTQKAVDRFRKRHGRNQSVGKGVTAATLRAMKKVARREVTAGELVSIMPGLSSSRAHALVPHLNRAMREFGIDTKKRQAAFLAQVGHESVGLRYFEEIASGAAYEGRADLGNVYPGDGVRYKGRGPIQLTGRANYRRAGEALGLPLEDHPKKAAKKSVGFRTAGWFWKTHGLNSLADAGSFDSISIAINGGTNGLADRRAYWARAKHVLGA